MNGVCVFLQKFKEGAKIWNRKKKTDGQKKA